MLLEVSTSIGCPVGCDYCPQDKALAAYRGPRLMSIDTFAAALAHCPEGCCVNVSGFAEPFLNRQTGAIIAMAAWNCHPVQVYTTGLGLTDGDAELLIGSRPARVVFHLAAEGMKVPVDEAFAARLHFVARSVPRCEAVCYGVPHPLLERLRPWLAGSKLQSRAGNVPAVANAAREGLAGPIRCGAAPGLDHPILLPDGSLVLCCQDFGQRHVIGNLAKQTWDEISRGDPLAALRAAMASENGAGAGACLCRTCEYAERM